MRQRGAGKPLSTTLSAREFGTRHSLTPHKQSRDEGCQTLHTIPGFIPKPNLRLEVHPLQNLSPSRLQAKHWVMTWQRTITSALWDVWRLIPRGGSLLGKGKGFSSSLSRRINLQTYPETPSQVALDLDNIVFTLWPTRAQHPWSVGPLMLFMPWRPL